MSTNAVNIKEKVSSETTRVSEAATLVSLAKDSHSGAFVSGNVKPVIFSPSPKSVSTKLSLVHSAISLHSSIIFIFYDAGTVKALEPVCSCLDSKKIDYRIIAFGTAQTLLSEHPNFVDPNKQLGLKTIVDRLNWPREKKLDIQEVDRLTQIISCQLVVVGMSSIVEAQIAKQLKDKGIKVIAYYDGFQDPDPDSLNLALVQSVDEVIVSLESTADGFLKMQSSLKTLVLGHPTIETWIQASNKVNAEDIRQKLGVSASEKVMLYAGGYGDSYEESFRLFVEASKSIKKYRIFISLHPKVDGDTEKKILKEMRVQRFQIISKEISTADASAISDVVVSERSTVGVQAFFIGKSVVYLDSKKEYSNVLIAKKLVSQVHDSEKFLNIIDSLTTDRKVLSETELYRVIGIPHRSSESIAECLIKKIAPRTLFIKTGDKAESFEEPVKPRKECARSPQG